MARPSEYGPHIIEQAMAFIAEREEQEILPTVEGLALHLGISRDTVYEWSKVHPEFSDIYERMMATQGDQLINNALVNKYNSSITKLLLSKHGYVERQDITSDGKALPTPILGGATLNEKTGEAEA